MANITLAQAAAWCGGKVEPQYADVSFFGASNDSRTICPGQLFVALVGVRDGNDFVDMALEKGAAAVLTSKRLGDYPAILVEDPRIALGKIAAGLRRHMAMMVVGVTGSVGKSTTKEMIASVLEGDHIVSKTPANFNNDLGLPMAILGMADDTQIGVLEMGMSHAGEISYLSHIAKPDIGVITNIGVMHMENFESQEGILRAKLEIVDGMDENARLCLYGDDGYLWNSWENISQNVTFFGRENPQCRILAKNVYQGEDGLHFTVQSENTEFPLTLPLEGEHYVADALAAVSVGLALGVAPERIAERLAHFRNIAGRQETFQAKGCTIINDSYNAGPESMEAALKVLGNRKGRRIALLGDMLELGERTKDAHHQLGVVASRYADVLLVLGPNAVHVAGGAKNADMPEESIFVFSDGATMAQKLKQIYHSGDVLLFKGSHGIHVERVLEKFLTEE